MDWSQILYLALIILATVYSKDKVIASVMWANFVCTMALAASPELVATVDLISICLLAGKNARRNIVAAIFVLMTPIYLVGTVLSWGGAATYAIIDVLAYLQLFVMGRGDVGIGNLGRRLRRRRNRRMASVEAGPETARRAEIREADNR